MRLKNKRKFFILLPIILGFILYSCVEEPTIAPVGPVFSVLKIANMSNNVDAINVSIDGKQVASSLAKGETTNYFDSNSGKLDFTVTNAAGEQIFEKTIDINVWERTKIIFAGNYDVDPLNNTFANFEVSEGETYISSKPPADSLYIQIVNASSTVDTINAKSYSISAHIVPPDTTIQYASNDSYSLPLTYGNIYASNGAPGEYTFYFVDSNEDTVTAGPYTLAADMFYNVYLYGNPMDLQVSLKEVVPPPIRSRD